MAMTACTPFLKGKISDLDCRWTVLSQGADERTKQDFCVEISSHGIQNGLIRLKLDLKKRINTPLSYLKYPDHAGSLTAPFEAGNLNLAPLKVTPAKRPLLPSFIA